MRPLRDGRAQTMLAQGVVGLSIQPLRHDSRWGHGQRKSDV